MKEHGKTAVSACLAGQKCRYDGQASPSGESFADCISVCPECLGGLPTPREPAEIVGGDGRDVLDGRARVLDARGRDVTEAFVQGAEKALAEIKKRGATHAVLKGKSPSCGTAAIYDGSFSGTMRKGKGVFAGLLERNGITTEER